MTAGWEEPASEAQAPSLSSDSQAGGPSLVERLESLASAAETSGLIEPEVRPLADGIRLFDKDAYEALVRIDGRYLYPTPEGAPGRLPRGAFASADAEVVLPPSLQRSRTSGPSRPFATALAALLGPTHRSSVAVAVAPLPRATGPTSRSR